MKTQAQLIVVLVVIFVKLDFISTSCFEHGIDLYRGDSLPSRNFVHSAEECQKMCYDSNFCYYFTWLQNMNVCYLKGMHGWENGIARVRGLAYRALSSVVVLIT